jgi:hypothetical protein
MPKKPTPKKSSPAAARTRKQSGAARIYDKPWFRFAVLALIAAVIAGFSLYTSRTSNATESKAREIADAFAEAFEDCDVEAITPLYLPLQTNPDKAKEFQESCRPGSHLTFNKKIQSPPSKKAENNVAFTYDFHEPDGRKGQVMVYLLYAPETSRWVVFSLTPTQTQ